MKKIFTILLLSFSLLSFSQKVKFKKEKVLIDNVEIYNYSEEGRMMSFSTLSGVEFLAIVSTSYQERNQFYNPKYSSSRPYLDHYVYTVKFLKSGKELTTDISMKDIANSIHKSGMVDENGNIDEAKIDIYITKYNNENLKLKIN